MGINGLKGKIDRISKSKIRKVKISPRDVVIDGYNWMITLLRRRCERPDRLVFCDHSEVREIAESWAEMMSESSIKIKVIVFDGCSYPEKEAEKVTRYRDRKKMFRRFLSIASGGVGGRYQCTYFSIHIHFFSIKSAYCFTHSLKILCTHLHNNTRTTDRDRKNPFVMTPFTTRCVIRALKRYKIPVLVTCCEADPRIAVLAKKSYVVTNDSDFFLENVYGVIRVESYLRMVEFEDSVCDVVFRRSLLFQELGLSRLSEEKRMEFLNSLPRWFGDDYHKLSSTQHGQAQRMSLFDVLQKYRSNQTPFVDPVSVTEIDWAIVVSNLRNAVSNFDDRNVVRNVRV
jgi:hypothetical protein